MPITIAKILAKLFLKLVMFQQQVCQKCYWQKIGLQPAFLLKLLISAKTARSVSSNAKFCIIQIICIILIRLKKYIPILN